MKLFIFAFILTVFSCVVFGQVKIKPSSDSVLYDGKKSTVAFLISNGGDNTVSGDVKAFVKNGSSQVTRPKITLKPKSYEIVTVEYSLDKNYSSSVVDFSFNGIKSQVKISSGIDLVSLDWKRKLYKTGDKRVGDITLSEDISTWETINIPFLLNAGGNIWCTTEFVIPKSFENQSIKLEIGTIDDNDVTYFNGQKIGETEGWDQKREYNIPNNIIKYGEKNILTICVENGENSGGGIVRMPMRIRVVEPGEKSTLNEPPSKIGNVKGDKIGSPLPLRQIVADNGVLRYENDGKEVALFGTNYYPMSWYQYVNMKATGKDMKEVIRKDLDHMKDMGIQVVRVHIFDREMSDKNGNLVQNENLDLLDYTFAECIKRNIYIYITAVGWWYSPVQLEDSFSSIYIKPEMQFNPAAKNAAADFTKNILNHVNPYTKTAYKDEKAVALVEIMNEPCYFVYGDLTSQAYDAQGESKESIEKARIVFNKLWKDWLVEHKLEINSESFSLFMYSLQRDYITQMVNAIKSTGSKAPVVVNYGFAQQSDYLLAAIADSEADAITNGAYPGGLGRQVDGVNQMPDFVENEGPNFPLYWGTDDGRFKNKAKVFYEFDNDGTVYCGYMYPAMAGAMRNGSVQISCQFQYDTLITADKNSDWDVHYLNYYYTPEKSLAFMAAINAFDHIKRGEKPVSVSKDEILFSCMAASFSKNMSVYADKEKLIYSRSLDSWQPCPVKIPQNPKYIAGLGSSEFISWSGSGAYIFKITGKDNADLTINPNVTFVGNPLKPNGEVAAELDYEPKELKIGYKGWENGKLYRKSDNNEVSKTGNVWVLKPGEYRLVK